MPLLLNKSCDADSCQTNMFFAAENRHLDVELNIISTNQKRKLFIFMAIELMKTNQYQIGFDKSKYSFKTSNQNRNREELFTLVQNTKNLQLEVGTNASTG